MQNNSRRTNSEVLKQEQIIFREQEDIERQMMIKDIELAQTENRNKDLSAEILELRKTLIKLEEQKPEALIKRDQVLQLEPCQLNLIQDITEHS